MAKNKRKDPNHLSFGRLMLWKSSDISAGWVNVIMLNYLNMLSSRAQMLNKKLWDVRIGNTYEKIISFLTLRCNTQQGPKTLYVKMEDFAEMLTDTRLNISTALNDMQDNGLIKLSRKKILVPELATLIDFCKNKKKKETNK